MEGLQQLQGANDPKIKQLRTLGHTRTTARGWRDKTKLPSYPVNFVLTGGGLGDYICHMTAFEWIATTQEHVYGRIFCAEPFLSVAKYIMGKYKKWSVYDPAEVEGVVKPMEALLTPAQYIKYVDAVGSHLMDLGFKYYAKLDGPPKGWDKMPDLTGYRSGKFWELPERYAVLTPGFTTEVRMMRGKYLNTISSYLLYRGITPVYLGKNTFAISGKNHTVAPTYKASFDEDFKPEMGIDLREQTTLLEATEIMSGAEMVLGIDNGLLHFAGCTEVPIVFGHTITDPRHRSIRRPIGETINIVNSPKDLPCAGCQSHMRFVPFHDFKYCMYGDKACIDMLFGNDCGIWKKAIDHILDLKKLSE